MPSLVSLLFTGATLVSLTVGYAIYFDYKRRNDSSFRRKVKKDMKLLEKIAHVVPEPEPTLDDLQERIDHTHPQEFPQFDSTGVDLQIEEILMKPGPEREKIFYGLLLKGEGLVKTGNKQDMENGIQCFYKALCLLPNPTELLTILQNTIPPTVFKQLLQLISDTSMKRIITYFRSIIPEGSAIEIRPTETKINGQDIPMFSIFAANDFHQYQVIYQESPIISVTSPYNHTSECCDNCYTRITKERVSCIKCHAQYCSDACLSNASNTYHPLLCSDSPTKELFDYSVDHPYVLLVARYMSTIFLEQLKAIKSLSQGTSYDPTNSIVSHFEYMRYYGQTPSSLDEKEAAIIRHVFKGHVPELEESLSTERYAAVKYRLMSTCVQFPLQASNNSISFGSISINDNDESCKETLKHQDSIQCIALFKCSGHIGQSKESNVVISQSSNNMISIIASKDISKGDELTLSYFSLPIILAKERCLNLIQ